MMTLSFIQFYYPSHNEVPFWCEVCYRILNYADKISANNPIVPEYSVALAQLDSH